MLNPIIIHNDIVSGHDLWMLTEKTVSTGEWKVIKDGWVNFHEPTINKYVKNKSIVIQAGGWQGLYPFLLSYLFDLVYTFEPNVLNFYCLSNNCRAENVFKFQAALSDKHEISILEETFLSGQSRILDNTKVKYDIPIIKRSQIYSMTIDSLTLPNCGFIMLDVENYEEYVIRGAIRTIKTYRPVICVEKSFDESRNISLKNLLINELGYQKALDINENIYYIDS